jgi:hypothetical protein
MLSVEATQLANMVYERSVVDNGADRQQSFKLKYVYSFLIRVVVPLTTTVRSYTQGRYCTIRNASKH